MEGLSGTPLRLVTKRSRMWVSVRIRRPAYFGLRFGLVDSRNSLAKSVTLADFNLARPDALDATPAFAVLGQYPAHVFD